MEEIIYFLNKKLQEAEDEAEREGWISEEDLKKELGVQKKRILCGQMFGIKLRTDESIDYWGEQQILEGDNNHEKKII